MSLAIVLFYQEAKVIPKSSLLIVTYWHIQIFSSIAGVIMIVVVAVVAVIMMVYYLTLKSVLLRFLKP